MSRTRRLTWQDAQDLVEPGTHLYYSAGLNEHHCETYVTVTHVGSTGCMVDVDQIVTKGELSPTKEGENIVAGWSELEITIP